MPYLFSRSARLAPGNLVDSMAWAMKMTEHVNTVSGLDVSLWSTVFSPKLGTLSWTAMVTDLTELEVSDEKLNADSGYLSLADEGAKFGTGELPDDSLVNLIFADPDAAASERTYASVVQAVLAPGNSVRGIELGVEIAQRAKKITGCPTSFGASQTGVYGEVGWIAVYDSVDQLQKAGEAIAADAAFATLLDKEAGKAYLPGASTQSVHRRVM
jgi:hypothetical protein